MAHEEREQVLVSPCALLARCMKTTGDESGALVHELYVLVLVPIPAKCFPVSAFPIPGYGKFSKNTYFFSGAKFFN